MSRKTRRSDFYRLLFLPDYRRARARAFLSYNRIPPRVFSSLRVFRNSLSHYSFCLWRKISGLRRVVPLDDQARVQFIKKRADPPRESARSLALDVRGAPVNRDTRDRFAKSILCNFVSYGRARTRVRRSDLVAFRPANRLDYD